MGYELVVDFFPWSRAVKLAKSKESKYAGYMPEYYAKDIEEEFIFSDTMGLGPLGFVQKKSLPFSWDSLDDLENIVIGTVQDYVNTEEFDKRAADGRIKIQTVVTDRLNVRMVAAGRIPLAVIDKNVFAYLLDNDESLTKYKHLVEFNSRLLEDKKLYICFRKGPEGEKLVRIFNEGVKKIDVSEIMSTHLNQ